MMTWLIKAKVKAIEKEIDGRVAIQKELSVEVQTIPWWRFAKKRELADEQDYQLGFIYGLKCAREILKDKTIR